MGNDKIENKFIQAHIPTGNKCVLGATTIATGYKFIDCLLTQRNICRHKMHNSW